MGEDLVEDCGVLVGPRAYASIKDHEALKHLKFEEGHDPEDENVKFFTVEGELKEYKYERAHNVGSSCPAVKTLLLRRPRPVLMMVAIHRCQPSCRTFGQACWIAW